VELYSEVAGAGPELVLLHGRVALEVALAAPERVTALVLVGSGLPGIEDVDPDARSRVAEMQRRAFELQRTAEDEEELFVDDVAERLERIANTAHVPSMERDQEFDRPVLGFLAEVA
jgi:hypothetical protein